VVAGGVLENVGADGEVEQQGGPLDLEAQNVPPLPPPPPPPPSHSRTSSEITLPGSRLLLGEVCGPNHIFLIAMAIASALFFGFMFVYWDAVDRV
jgi:hypothetical protein